MMAFFFGLHLNLGGKNGLIPSEHLFLVFIILKFPGPRFQKSCVR